MYSCGYSKYGNNENPYALRMMSSVEYSGVQKGLYGPMIIEVSRINSKFLVIQTLGNQILFADKQNPTVQIKRVPLPPLPAVTAAAATSDCNSSSTDCVYIRIRI